MKLLVTGASGFLGRYVVAEALRHGHTVRAMVRPATDASWLSWFDHPKVELARLDLRSMAGLVDAVRGVDAVLHLAADKTSDFYAQFAANVVATENLLDAMTQADVKRLVAISTFSVYDTLRMASGSLLVESSPIEADPLARDDYARTKLVQEQVIRRYADARELALTVLRPGMLYGKDNLYNARVGIAVGRRTWVRLGGRVLMPLSYVENCADAIVLSAEKDEAIGQTMNIVDDDLPTHTQYVRLLCERMAPDQRVVPIAWPLMRMMARCVWLTNKLLLGGRAKVPGIFAPARLHARAKPLRYTNVKLKHTLGWQPRYTLNEALDRSLDDQMPGDSQANPQSPNTDPAPENPHLQTST